MDKIVEDRVKEVLRKYSFGIEFLDVKYSKNEALSKAKREIAYVLVKEFNYTRGQVGNILHCKVPMVSELVLRHCKGNNLAIPKHRKEGHPVNTLVSFLVENKHTPSENELHKLLMNLWQVSFRLGYGKARKKYFGKSSFPGVPSVPAVKNNAPVSILRPPGHVLNEGKDDQIRAQSSVKRGDRARKTSVR